MRDLDRFREITEPALVEAGEALVEAQSLEEAFSILTRSARDCLGDREARARPGALKAGEHQFFVSGVFMVRPGARGHVLVAEHGFPPEQHRLRIPIDIGHPGRVWAEQKPLLLANTDDHDDFKQILQTARMGSALYAPLFQRRNMVGQIIAAAQARNTFEFADLEVLCGFATFASLAYVAHDGAKFLESLEFN